MVDIDHHARKVPAVTLDPLEFEFETFLDKPVVIETGKPVGY
jgi:hypothetical protein